MHTEYSISILDANVINADKEIFTFFDNTNDDDDDDDDDQ